MHLEAGELINFHRFINSISIHLDFHAERLENHVQCTFIITFLCSWFLIFFSIRVPIEYEYFKTDLFDKWQELWQVLPLPVRVDLGEMVRVIHWTPLFVKEVLPLYMVYKQHILSPDHRVQSYWIFENLHTTHLMSKGKWRRFGLVWVILWDINHCKYLIPNPSFININFYSKQFSLA